MSQREKIASNIADVGIQQTLARSSVCPERPIVTRAASIRNVWSAVRMQGKSLG